MIQIESLRKRSEEKARVDSAEREVNQQMLDTKNEWK